MNKLYRAEKRNTSNRSNKNLPTKGVHDDTKLTNSIIVECQQMTKNSDFIRVFYD